MLCSGGIGLILRGGARKLLGLVLCAYGLNFRALESFFTVYFGELLVLLLLPSSASTSTKPRLRLALISISSPTHPLSNSGELGSI